MFSLECECGNFERVYFSEPYWLSYFLIVQSSIYKPWRLLRPQGQWSQILIVGWKEIRMQRKKIIGKLGFLSPSGVRLLDSGIRLLGMTYTYLGVAYAFLVREWYWTLEVGLVLQALISEHYILGLTRDIDHFDKEWVFLSLRPRTQVVGDTKCGVQNHHRQQTTATAPTTTPITNNHITTTTK